MLLPDRREHFQNRLGERKMQKIQLANTELTVSEICLGADVFGSKHNEETSFAMLDLFVESGGNFVDTANLYARDWSAGISRSEEMLAKYLRARPGTELVIATKGGHPMPASMHTSRLTKAEVEKDLDESLRTLGLDCIDFYWLHRDDPAQPIEAIVDLLESFVRAGKIRYYGGSNYTVERMKQAKAYADAAGLQGFAGLSNMWSPAVQNPDCPLSKDDTLVRLENADLAALAQLGLTLIPYSSTAKGWFAKTAAGNSNERLDAIYKNEENLALLDRLSEAAALDRIPIQTALLIYMRSLGDFEGLPIIPITSCSTLDQLCEVLKV